MQEEKDDLEEKESPEQKASKVDKQYAEQMAFIAQVLGSDTAINPSKVLSGDAVANVVARLFKNREEKLAAQVLDGLDKLVETHLAAEEAIKKDEQALKAKKTEKRKEFIKVAKAWRNMINQQEITKENYATALKEAIAASKEE
jgi:hypothetical protein